MKKRYIDYEKLRRILKHRQTVRNTPERRDEIGEIIAVIDSMSTDSGIHARWLTTEAYPHWLYCSNCHMRFVPDHEWLAAYSIPANFCPHCGKPMWNGDSQNIWCGDMLTPKKFELIDREKLLELIDKELSRMPKNNAVERAFRIFQDCVRKCPTTNIGEPERRQVCPKREKGEEHGQRTPD